MLKLVDYKKYKQYKYDLSNHKIRQKTALAILSNQLYTLPQLKEFSLRSKSINVTHSGNAGDIIYSLATLKRMHELTGLKIKLYLMLDQQIKLPVYRVHPLGNVGLNKQMANMLIPLLSMQDYIANCEIHQNQPIDIDLSVFRNLAIPSDKGNLAHWYSYITGVTPQLYKTWLTVDADKNYANTILIARSSRYRSSFIDYSFLNRYSNLLFLGIESEYNDMKTLLPGLKWLEVKDFKALAQVIAGCKFFVGNQSLPFAIAESLKVPRILETYFHAPNVITEGDNGYDFYFQRHFEALVEELNSVN